LRWRALGDELVTALVKNASALDFVSFVRTLQTQIRKARAGEDQADASVQLLLTYMGGYQMVDAIPVLVSPAAAILFAGEAFPVDGVPHVNLVLTFDHRLINGVGGAEFLERGRRESRGCRVAGCARDVGGNIIDRARFTSRPPP